ncbi:uncharacterized protein LOC144432641 isoform X2 [Glandiceps talaboti]
MDLRIVICSSCSLGVPLCCYRRNTKRYFITKVACPSYKYLTGIQTMVAGIKMVQPFQRATYQQVVESTDPCAICLAPLHEGRFTPCRHIFHSKCLATHLNFKRTCPMCNTPLIQITRVGPRHVVVHHHRRNQHANNHAPQEPGPNHPGPNPPGPIPPGPNHHGPNPPGPNPPGPNPPGPNPQVDHGHAQQIYPDR